MSEIAILWRDSTCDINNVISVGERLLLAELFQRLQRLSSERAPPGRRVRASLFGSVAADELTLLIKVVVDLGVIRTEVLQSLRPPKSLHGSLAPAKRLMRILRAIIEPTTIMSTRDADIFHRRTIGPQPVRDDS